MSEKLAKSETPILMAIFANKLLWYTKLHIKHVRIKSELAGKSASG
jgi:hypothetical protein